MKAPAIGMMLLCLLPLCACCKAQEQKAMIDVPSVLTTQVQEPDASGLSTNGDLLELLLDYQLSLRLCNSKITTIGKAYGAGDK